MSEASIFSRTLTLRDWSFVFALPDTPRSFCRAQALGEFCTIFSDFSDYTKRLLGTFNRTIPVYAERDLRVVCSASSKDFIRELHGDHAVVLFAHCSRGSFEFSDGMIPFTDLARRTPRSFCGIADVCACNAAGFETVLKARAPNCGVKVMQTSLSAEAWLYFYFFFFEKFRTGSSYADAVMATTMEYEALLQDDQLHGGHRQRS